MSVYLLATIISCFLHFSTIVPFINLLYRLKFQRAAQETKDAFNKPTPIFDSFHRLKKGTPVGGGILMVILVSFLFVVTLVIMAITNRPINSNYPSILSEVKIILFTFISFAFLGVYDDIAKMFQLKEQSFFGLRLRHKFILELILAVIISYWISSELKISFFHAPFIGVIDIGPFYMVFSTFIIVAFANAVNITDGLDGLSSGVLLITLAGFWVVARSIIDVPMSVFIAIWIGALISFLYFNTYPARLMLGDTGALSFGATFAVIGLLLGKTFSLPVIGGVFVVEIASSFIQLMGKKYLKKKIFPVAPLHLWLQLRGWPEPKIVMRLWIVSLIFVLLGLMIAFMK